MKKNKPTGIWLIVGGIVALIIVIAGISALAINLGNNDGSDSTTSPSASASSEGENTGSELAPDQIGIHKENARNAAIDMLELAAENPTDETVDERVAKLASGDESVINEELLKFIRFEDLIEADADLRANSLQSVVAIAVSMESAGGIGEVDDAIATALVYVDVEAGVAYVPMSSLSTTGLPVSLEMVYVDGQWQLSPYPLLDMVRMSALAQGLNPTTGESMSSSD